MFVDYFTKYIGPPKSCASIDVQFIFVQVFACQMSKTCKNFVKNTHCLGPHVNQP